MNCNQAFELMTDPVGAASPALQRHLERCPRCRQMQQTLSPALDWLRSAEASLPDQTDADRKAVPLLTAQAVLLAEDVARNLPRRRTRLGAEAARRAAMIAAVAAFGVWLGAVFLDSSPREQPSAPAPALTACLWEQRQLLEHLPDASPRGVLLSCLTCHVPNTLD
jgi:hypothetical protein